MSNRAYTLIFVLLSCCVVCVLALQAYWIRSFYLREKDAFSRNVYSGLEKVATKIHERKSLQAIKTTYTYFISNGDTICKTPSRNMVFRSEGNVKVINHNGKIVKTRSIRKDRTNQKSRDSLVINGTDTSVTLVIPGKHPHVIPFDSSISVKVQKELDKAMAEAEGAKELIDKMMMEIKVMDTDTEDPDSLSQLIRRTFENQGLFLPFEFSMQNISGPKTQLLAQSKGFSNEEMSYKTDLSAGNVIKTNDYLLVQFPGRRGFVLSGMKGSLGLSIVFSLFILAIVYYVLRLITQQKKLSDIKNDFVNNMTHELKTPIATISLAVDGLAHPQVRQDAVRTAEYMRILKEENQKLNRHVERVLQMALLEGGKLQLQRMQLDLIAVIRAAIDAYALQIRQYGAAVEFFTSEEKVLFSGDELHLGNVFTNLLDNGLKYSYEGNSVITITLQRSGQDIIIRVKDNGIGIAAAHREKVFEKFYRVQGGNLHDVKGFGLGLSYVRSVVEAHGGSIELHSEAGKGSEFIITFRAHAG